MGNRSPFLTCVVCCVVALCRRSVTLESVKAERDKEVNDLSPPDAQSQSPPAPAHFFARHQPDMGEEHGRLQPQAQEELRQPDAPSVAFAELVPSSVGACASFVDNGQSADEDVSCFPHDKNIGSLSYPTKVVVTETVQGCLKECRAVDTCTHYTWNKKSKRCHLKNAVPELYTYDGDMTGPRSCKSSCYSKCLKYNMQPWKTLQYPNQPPQICHTACWAQRDNCIMWSFENGACTLYSKGFSAHRAVGGDTMITASRRHCETMPDIRLLELGDGQSIGSCLANDDIGSKADTIVQPLAKPNILECQKRCASDNKCTHYTYNRYAKTCYIKAGEPVYYRFRGDATGARDCVPDL